MGRNGFFSWFRPAPRPRFTLGDFMAQMDQVQALGPMRKVMQMIPGMDEMTKQINVGASEIEAEFGRMRAIFCSMTNGEREATEPLTGSRRSRIAAGAGVHTREVSAFLRQFEMSREMMDRVGLP